MARTPVDVTGRTDVTAVASFGSGGYALSPLRVPGLTGVSAISGGGGADLGYAVS